MAVALLQYPPNGLHIRSAVCKLIALISVEYNTQTHTHKYRTYILPKQGCQKELAATLQCLLEVSTAGYL